VYCYLFIVETKGLSLEETAALFDGEEAEDAITGARTTGDREVSEKGALSREVDNALRA
jgi:hypothetical protein